MIAEDRDRYPVLSEERNPSTSWYLDDGVTTEQLLELMGGAGVHGVALVQPGSTYGDDNRYVIDSIARHPAQCVGVAGAIHHPIEPERVRALVEADGVHGLRLFDVGTGVLADPRTKPVAEELAGLDVPLVVRTDLRGVADVVALVRAVPGLDVVLDHCAIAHGPVPGATPPWAVGGPLRALVDHERVVLKVSPIVFDHVSEADLAGAGRDLVAAFGGDRIVWGSDFPHSPGPYADIVATVARFVDEVDSASQSAVLGGTACRLWPVLGAITASN